MIKTGFSKRDIGFAIQLAQRKHGLSSPLMPSKETRTYRR